MRIVLFLVILSINFSSFAKESLNIAVASNFHDPIKLIQKQFERKNKVNLIIIKGSTAQLYTQIINRAPVDIFLSADQITPKKINRSLVVQNSQFTYATGKLVLWTSLIWNKKNNSKLFLESEKTKILSIANPNVSPYGKASKEYLKNIGVWKKYKNKVALANNINQVVSFLYSGSADSGLIAYSDKIKLNKIYNGTFLDVPKNLYKPLKQDAILLKRSMNNAFAKKFIFFLKSKEIKMIIRSFGYIVD